MGSFLSGRAAKHVSLPKILLLNAVAENSIILLLFLWRVKPDHNQTATLYIASSALGHCRGVFESQVPSCYSFLWPHGGRVAATSALYFASRAAGSCLMFLLDGVLYPVAQLAILVVALNLGVLLMVLALKIKDEGSRLRRKSVAEPLELSGLL